MPSSYFSRLCSTFRWGVRRAIVSQEVGLLDAVELMFSQGKYFLVHSRLFNSGAFVSLNDLRALLRPGKLASAQSNLCFVNRRKNLLVPGALFLTFSTPVSGPSIQVFGYHIDRLLADPSEFSSGINNHRAPMSVSNTRAFPADCYLSILTHRSLHPQMSAHHPCISVNYGCYDGCGKARMGLRNKEQPNRFMIYGYFAYNIAKRRGNSNPYPALGLKNFQTLSPASFSAGTSPDVSFDNSAHEKQLANSADSSNQKMITGRALKLQSASCYLPHPDKEETGGEDAHFICAYDQAIGVADGVGGWADLGIDAGQYARELMSNSVKSVQEEPKGSIDPARVLEKAYLSTQAKGSSTACIIALTDQGLHAINLGDSGFMVVRDGCKVFRSPVQQHDFNFTYQLESGNRADLPSSGQVFVIPVAPGDVIVAGTDGLFDNLYNNDITTVVVHAMRSGVGPQVTAQKIAALARQRAQDKNRQTPFSAAAQEAGFRYYGGKLDDITVVVSYITIDTNQKAPECGSG